VLVGVVVLYYFKGFRFSEVRKAMEAFRRSDMWIHSRTFDQ